MRVRSDLQFKAVSSKSDQPIVLTINEAAAILRVSRQSAYEAARRGEIPTIKIGRRLLVPRARLEKLIQGIVES